MAMSQRSYCDSTAIPRRPWRFYGAPWRVYGVLVGDWLHSHGALTALTLRTSNCHGARTVLTAYCLNSKVIEMTGRVLISQVLLDGVHQSIFPKPKSCIFQAGINNTLVIPLTQIYVIKSARVILNKKALRRRLQNVLLNDSKWFSWPCSLSKSTTIKYRQNYFTFTNEIHSKNLLFAEQLNVELFRNFRLLWGLLWNSFSRCKNVHHLFKTFKFRYLNIVSISNIPLISNAY